MGGDLRRTANHARFRPGARVGHYESWFQRANHPTRPLAFWIRYTIFSPAGRPEDAVAELWAVFFDGETGDHTAVKQELPIAEGRFATDGFVVSIGEAELSGEGGSGALRGEVTTSEHRVGWDLRYRGEDRPLLLFPAALYRTPLPKAKALVGVPGAVYEGAITVDGRTIDVGGWVGSQNHNWGSKHTDHYAWGQVCGFDGATESFLEVGCGKLKLGPVWTPYLTPLVLRHRGREVAVNGLVEIVRTRASIAYFELRFDTGGETGVRFEGRIYADAGDFVGLAYNNPPGGVKHCLNSKIASCELMVCDAGTGEVERLRATRRAALEILTDDRGHGVAIRA